MVSTQLTCPSGGTCGYTTEEVEMNIAVELLKLHYERLLSDWSSYACCTAGLATSLSSTTGDNYFTLTESR